MEKQKGSGSIGTIVAVVILAILAIYYFAHKKADAPSNEDSMQSESGQMIDGSMETDSSSASASTELETEVGSFDSSFSDMSSSDLDL